LFNWRGRFNRGNPSSGRAGDGGPFLYAIGPGGIEPLSTKSTGNPLLDAFYGIREETGEFTHDPQGYARAYKANVWAFRCVRLRSRTLASIPLEIQDGAGAVLDTHPLARALGQKNTRLMRSTESDLQLFGDAYWTFGAGPRGGWLKRQNPQTIERDATAGGIQGYTQRIEGQAIARWTPSQIVHFYDYNPDDDLGGLSTMSLALGAAGVINNMSAFAHYFFKHGAMPLGVLMVKNRLADADRERLHAEWERKFAGVRNAHRTAIFDGGEVEYTPVTPPPSELAMVDLREEERRDIAAAFGVPMSIALAADPALYAAKQDYANFHTLEILPELDLLVDAMNTHLLPRYGVVGAQVVPNLNDVEALQEDRGEITIRNAAGVTAGYLSLNTALERENEEPLATDYLIIGGRLVPKALLDSGDFDALRELGVLGQPAPAAWGFPNTALPAPRETEIPAEMPDDVPAQIPANVVSTEGLNGAQIDAALRIMEGLANGITPPTVAFELLIALGIEEDRVRRMVYEANIGAAAQRRVRPIIIEGKTSRATVDLVIHAANSEAAQTARDKAVADTMLRDLDRWRRKVAKKGVQTPFEPDYLPSAVTDWLRADLLAWDGETERTDWIAAAFERAETALKAVGDTATPEESEAYWQGIGALFDAVGETFETLFAALPARIAAALRESGQSGAAFDLSAFLERETPGMVEALSGAEGPLPRMILAGAARGNDLLARGKSVKQEGLTIDWQVLDAYAQQWAKEYAAQKVRGINETTLRVFQEKIAEWIESGGSLEDLAKYIEGDLTGLDIPPGWSPGKIAWATSRDRARLIAQSETTEAFHEGAVTRWEQAGVPEKRWRTQNDTRVDDDICRPLNNVVTKLRELWTHPKTGKRYGMPAHPSCRCYPAPEGF
jgi:HK97 family phage portal protein